MSIYDIVINQIDIFRRIGIIAFIEDFGEHTGKFSLICSPTIPATTNWQSFKQTLQDKKSFEYLSVTVNQRYPDEDENYQYEVKYVIDVSKRFSNLEKL